MDIIKFLWQLPQNIAGLCMLLWNYNDTLKITDSDGITFYYARYVNNCGVSLGKYIILDSDRNISQNDIRHEWGHSRQSLILGPLYLIIVGIPSALHNIWYRKHKKGNYYDFWCEKWADRLGGVKRG